MTSWKVSSQESGSKLLNFLREKTGLGTRVVKRALELNQCSVNGKVERFGTTVVGAGDQIRFEHDIHEKAKFDSSSIVFQDAHLLVYNKPSGITSEDLQKEFFPDYFLIHRLDKDTTGILLIAKEKEVFQKMVEQFKAHLIEKKYLAIIDGIPHKGEGVVKNFLGKLKSYQGQTIWGSVSKDGLYAETSWKVIERGNKACLVECEPKTGRTHQIRVHLSGLGHPILGDYQYGHEFKSTAKPQRALLHAYEIGFKHPITHKSLNFTQLPPKDFHLP